MFSLVPQPMNLTLFEWLKPAMMSTSLWKCWETSHHFCCMLSPNQYDLYTSLASPDAIFSSRNLVSLNPLEPPMHLSVGALSIKTLLGFRFQIVFMMLNSVISGHIKIQYIQGFITITLSPRNKIYWI